MTDWNDLETSLAGEATNEEKCDLVLGWALERTSTISGTVHLMQADGLLHLAASRNIPDELLPIMSKIPVGKGMAGLAAERRAPVTTCDLQTDTSGDARPGAKTTGLRGTVAVPMLFGKEADTADIRGVLGVGHVHEHEFTEEERALLLEAGRRLATALGGQEG